ncbi:hypothetical protein N9R80_00215 [bacterium]|nr:hypothetical protein [bacterium]
MADNMFFSRDTKVYVAPLNPSTGNEQALFEVPVLDGFSFSQSTNSSEVTLNEMSAGSNASRRGRKMFNDSLAPAEWSFSTYARPFKTGGGGGATDASDTSGQVHAVEEVLWAMMVGDATYSGSTTNAGAVASISGATSFSSLTGADKLGANATFDLETTTDGGGGGCQIRLTYTELTGGIAATLHASNEKGSGYTANDKLFISKEEIEEAMGLSSGTINPAGDDFSCTVASIANATGGTSFQGFTRTSGSLAIDFSNSNKTKLGTANIYFVVGKTGGSNSGELTYKISNCCVNEVGCDFDIDGITTLNWSGMGAELIEQDTDLVTTAAIIEGTTATNNFIRNRLTELVASNGGGTSQVLTLTGGSVTISNNMTFLTPETLGIVNTPLAHVTGTRSVSGSFTCYLNNDDNASAALFESLVEDKSTVTHDFDLEFKVGGNSAPNLTFDMPSCHLEVPSHSIEDVISLEVSFHALGTDIDSTDEVVVTYKGVNLPS